MRKKNRWSQYEVYIVQDNLGDTSRHNQQNKVSISKLALSWDLMLLAESKPLV